MTSVMKEFLKSLNLLKPKLLEHFCLLFSGFFVKYMLIFRFSVLIEID